MSESRPSTPEEFPLVVTLLRENIQDLHQDIRDLRSELKQDIGDLGAKMDARFARLNTTLIAVAGVVVAAVGALAAVLKV
ncbi:MAG: hypothetical protein ACPHO6_09535 [Candidatus Latescibacterota bacterium]